MSGPQSPATWTTGQARNTDATGPALNGMPYSSRGRNAIEYHEIVPYEKIVSDMYFADSQGNKVEAETYGIEHEAIEGAHDVTLSPQRYRGYCGRTPRFRATPQRKQLYAGGETGLLAAWHLPRSPRPSGRRIARCPKARYFSRKKRKLTRSPP